MCMSWECQSLHLIMNSTTANQLLVYMYKIMSWKGMHPHPSSMCILYSYNNTDFSIENIDNLVIKYTPRRTKLKKNISGACPRTLPSKCMATLQFYN